MTELMNEQRNVSQGWRGGLRIRSILRMTAVHDMQARCGCIDC